MSDKEDSLQDESKWKSMRRKLTPAPATFAKVSYLGIIFVGFILCIIVRDHIFGLLYVQIPIPDYWYIKLLTNDTLFSPYADYIEPFWHQTFNVTLTGFASVHRVSVSMGFFFIVHFLLSLIGCIPSAKVAAFSMFFNANPWLAGVKYIFYIIFLILMFFIHDTVFIVTAWISIFISALFLVIQVIMLMQVAFDWQEYYTKLDKREIEERSLDEDECNCTCGVSLYITSTIGLYVLCVGFVIFCFVMFSVGSQWCWWLYFAIVGTIVLCGLIIIMSFIPKLAVGILPPAIVSLYMIYMCYSALLSYPDSSCNLFSGVYKIVGETTNTTNPIMVNMNNFGQIFSIVITIIFALVATIYSAMSKSGSMQKAFTIKKCWGEDEEESVDDDEDDVGKKAITSARGMCWSHIVFFFCSVYIGTILTNWEVMEASDSPLTVNGKYTIGVSWIAFAVKLLMIVITFVMFVWIVIKQAFIDDEHETDDD